MGISLIAHRFITKEQAFDYCDDELWDRISEYGVPKEPDSLIDAEYLGIYIDNEMNGFWVLSHLNSSTLDIHINLKKEHRANSKEIGAEFLEMVFSNKNINKVQAEVPDCYQDVIHFIKGFGFSEEGLFKEHINKNNQFTDCVILGLTRGDYERG